MDEEIVNVRCQSVDGGALPGVPFEIDSRNTRVGTKDDKMSRFRRAAVKDLINGMPDKGEGKIRDTGEDTAIRS